LEQSFVCLTLTAALRPLYGPCMALLGLACFMLFRPSSLLRHSLHLILSRVPIRLRAPNRVALRATPPSLPPPAPPPLSSTSTCQLRRPSRDPYRTMVGDVCLFGCDRRLAVGIFWWGAGLKEGVYFHCFDWIFFHCEKRREERCEAMRLDKRGRRQWTTQLHHHITMAIIDAVRILHTPHLAWGSLWFVLVVIFVTLSIRSDCVLYSH
jgi:hypothetical protein